jgi:hypothetical protein
MNFDWRLKTVAVVTVLALLVTQSGCFTLAVISISEGEPAIKGDGELFIAMLVVEIVIWPIAIADVLVGSVLFITLTRQKREAQTPVYAPEPEHRVRRERYEEPPTQRLRREPPPP